MCRKVMGFFNRQSHVLLWVVASLWYAPITVRATKIESSISAANDELIQNSSQRQLVGSQLRQIVGFQLRQSSDLQDCVNDLYASDQNGDLKIDEEEYVYFINSQSRGEIDVEDYSELPFSLVSNFVYGSCFCSFVLGIPDCCVGENAGIDIDPDQSPLIEDNLITICRTATTTIQSIVGTFAPTISPETDSPSASPTNIVTEEPSESPTEEPTAEHSLEPTTQEPTKAPTDLSSSTPTLTVTDPIPPVPPIPDDELLCLNFQYGIQNNKGLTADDIDNGVDNTFKSDLLVATRDTLIQILNETFPEDDRMLLRKNVLGRRSWSLFDPVDYFETSQQQLLGVVTLVPSSNSEFGRTTKREPSQQAVLSLANNNNHHRRRKLAFYVDSNPPEITSIFDNSFCQATDEETSCAIVETRVCVVLEEGDDPKETRDRLFDGFKTAFQDGSFQSALHSQKR